MQRRSPQVGRVGHLSSLPASCVFFESHYSLLTRYRGIQVYTWYIMTLRASSDRRPFSFRVFCSGTEACLLTGTLRGETRSHLYIKIEIQLQIKTHRYNLSTSCMCMCMYLYINTLCILYIRSIPAVLLWGVAGVYFYGSNGKASAVTDGQPSIPRGVQLDRPIIF